MKLKYKPKGENIGILVYLNGTIAAVDVAPDLGKKIVRRYNCFENGLFTERRRKVNERAE